MNHQTSVSEKAEELSLAPSRCPLCAGTSVTSFLRGPDRFHLRHEMFSLAKCHSCSCVWLTNVPEPEDMPFHYGADYYQGVTVAGEVSKRWQKQQMVISRQGKGGDLLDIGCSSGGFLRTLRGGAWKLHGIEMSPAMADRARVRTGANIFVGDALSASFGAECFDVVTCFDVLEHVCAPRQLLDRVSKWLRPGGIFYTMLPNINSWEARLFGSYWYGLELPRHFFHFSPQSLRRTAEAVGLEAVSVVTQPTSYLEFSTRYVWGEIFTRLGGSPTPLAKPAQRPIAWRALRKILRLSVIAPLGFLASAVGAGAQIEAIFVKPPIGRN